jgi:tellurite resistance protein
MASSSKAKTTMAKLNRERALRERRELKQAKKEARKLAKTAPPVAPEDGPTGESSHES